MKMVWGVLGCSGNKWIQSTGWQQLAQRKWTWWMMRADFQSFVAISVASSWEDTVLDAGAQEPGMASQDGEDNGQSHAKVMKLRMLKSEILSLLTGLSWYCLCCVYSVLMVESDLLLRWFYGSAERESRIFSTPCSGWMQTTSGEQCL